jgi:hypothetical protein
MKIDAVITWVDGADIALRDKRMRYQNEKTKVHETRFSNRGEIYYCISSILKYAKFINRIFIVTDNQLPLHINEFEKAGLCKYEYIKVIDHREIFREYEYLLPTFNARSIETVLWRINELSEHYVYFNDDFFINKYINQSDFFVGEHPLINAKPLSLNFFKVKKYINNKIKRNKNQVASHRLSQYLSAELLGMKSINFVNHSPHPLRRSTQEKFYTVEKNIFLKQISFKFRSSEQFNPVSLSNNLEVLNNDAKIYSPEQIVYIKPKMSRALSSELAKISLETTKFGCIQSLDLFPESNLLEIRKVMNEKLKGYLPEKIILLLNKYDNER